MISKLDLKVLGLTVFSAASGLFTALGLLKQFGEHPELVPFKTGYIAEVLLTAFLLVLLLYKSAIRNFNSVPNLLIRIAIAAAVYGAGRPVLQYFLKTGGIFAT